MGHKLLLILPAFSRVEVEEQGRFVNGRTGSRVGEWSSQEHRSGL
jgi:uracil-DNA glycosylase